MLKVAGIVFEVDKCSTAFQTSCSILCQNPGKGQKFKMKGHHRTSGNRIFTFMKWVLCLLCSGHQIIFAISPKTILFQKDCRCFSLTLKTAALYTKLLKILYFLIRNPE